MRGKDVYVEKPFSLFIKEGRWMVEAARKHNRIVQVGTQNRSGPVIERARQLTAGGELGEIVSAQANYFRNLLPPGQHLAADGAQARMGCG